MRRRAASPTRPSSRSAWPSPSRPHPSAGPTRARAGVRAPDPARRRRRDRVRPRRRWPGRSRVSPGVPRPPRKRGSDRALHARLGPPRFPLSRRPHRPPDRPSPVQPRREGARRDGVPPHIRPVQAGLARLDPAGVPSRPFQQALPHARFGPAEERPRRQPPSPEGSPGRTAKRSLGRGRPGSPATARHRGDAERSPRSSGEAPSRASCPAGRAAPIGASHTAHTASVTPWGPAFPVMPRRRERNSDPSEAWTEPTWGHWWKHKSPGPKYSRQCRRLGKQRWRRGWDSNPR